MKVSDLRHIDVFDKVRIHSLESSLYQLSVIVDGSEDYVHKDSGGFLTSHNKLDLQSLFTEKMVGEMVLCHQSAYDEMVGQPMKEGGNMLEVPLGNSSLSV
ncbi:DUF6482 family protein [Marinomonas mediterranea]|jgi:hypothetical protein|uniref:Na(+)-translocating NADH-quinone reductase subunit B n=1 Tax=Marinomonas mediterranea (strain ATCC 700492 / JCM 21426 / NBRC 103028 / MMB-1) TaxID=717774 RepID=F2JU22_MARM1|nr:DUF6482 family protein [Marinomonas mediterranea]ADZ90443.1 hypothetical protein Marme_1170 [Marinomonas mediterranea MMB-1]WCN08499.1 hypothetical protein GV055_05955 [Marinomonas mediterranea]WCN16626.1 hypothetical protein GV053_05925 [Marinomonas mediterranea MMB-1]